MRLHTEAIYGFYHGQDPRTFSPDKESCTEAEIKGHASACDSAAAGTWVPDHSGCRVTKNVIMCQSSFGVGVYHVVMSDDGNFIRDATFADYCQEGEWEEEQSA